MFNPPPSLISGSPASRNSSLYYMSPSRPATQYGQPWKKSVCPEKELQLMATPEHVLTLSSASNPGKK
ncbi:hypothetical protein JCGZ_15223 [Jatropha curcas]|uniref:Uncharacterized protein n=1 Tax=Jatropha curcas TaxID=180498 RepID=A0A067K6B6_JATCU|nr:hypothetical protein JCGZ_15223 [Jatropha curcas]